MDEVQVDRILQNPKFKEMVAKKSRLSWTLTAIMLFVYVGFMLLVGYNKEFLLSSLSGGVTTWGIPLGLGIIVLSFIYAASIPISRITVLINLLKKQFVK